MFRIQNLTFKKNLFFLVISLSAATAGQGQAMREQLKEADSLFKQKRYTQSFDIYHHILDSANNASPAMLLKMAFIREGLGDYSQALYYLNLYYLRTNNKRALRKMEDLANKYNLHGYRYTDLEFFLNIFRRYYLIFVTAIGSMSLMFLAYIIYKKRRLRERPGFSLFYFILTLIMLFYMVNFGNVYNKGIIMKPRSYLMAGPSSGSGLIAIADQGHRLRIKGHEDVWVKVQWEGHDAYIREGNILEIPGSR